MTGNSFELLLRELAPQVLGAVLRRYRDFADAEDAVQEALLSAVTQWPQEGMPDQPRAWLIQVASRRMADRVRNESARRTREVEVAMSAGYIIPPHTEFADTDEDDTLILITLCCHESLTTSSAVALTLRAVGGLTTAEIARAFLVPESTMAQRISRAKQTIRDAGVPFRLPARDAQAPRLQAVLHVLYLIFTEGYTASAGAHLQRLDLATEAIRLTRLLHAKLPGNPETAGLLALMLLTHARRAARTGVADEIIPLDKQDRSLWDAAMIAEGLELLSAALARGSVGPYQLQAAIAAVHDEAATARDTDWPQILALYTVLKRVVDNPMVLLNHAVAVAMVNGPEAGLRLVDQLAATDRLRDHHRLYAVRAHLLERAERWAEAVESYRAAAIRTANLPERNFLIASAARLERSSKQSG